MTFVALAVGLVPHTLPGKFFHSPSVPLSLSMCQKQGNMRDFTVGCPQYVLPGVGWEELNPSLV